MLGGGFGGAGGVTGGGWTARDVGAPGTWVLDGGFGAGGGVTGGGWTARDVGAPGTWVLDGGFGAGGGVTGGGWTARDVGARGATGGGAATGGFSGSRGSESGAADGVAAGAEAAGGTLTGGGSRAGVSPANSSSIDSNSSSIESNSSSRPGGGAAWGSAAGAGLIARTRPGSGLRLLRALGHPAEVPAPVRGYPAPARGQAPHQVPRASVGWSTDRGCDRPIPRRSGPAPAVIPPEFAAPSGTNRNRPHQPSCGYSS